jgi:hypothetical protein
VRGAAAAGLGGHQGAEPGGGGEGGQIGGGARVADRAALLIGAGLGEAAAQLDLAGAGPAVLALAGTAFGLGRDHRHAGPVDRDVQDAGQRPGRRHRDQGARGDRGGAGLDDAGGGLAAGFGAAPGPLAGQGDPGQLAHQGGGLGERHRRGGPGGHLPQPR